MSTENVCYVGRGVIHWSWSFTALALSGNSKCLQVFTKVRSSSKSTPALTSTPLMLKATHAPAQDPTGTHQSEAVLFGSSRLSASAASALPTTNHLNYCKAHQTEGCCSMQHHIKPWRPLASFSETFRCFWAAKHCSSLSS